MSARIDIEKLNALVEDGWVRTQRHPDADLWIFNYTEKTQFENHWTPETLMCRGLILSEAGEVVARPFAKFFNYGTEQAFIPEGESYTVTEKLDGSLGILYPLDGELRVATRGSFTSEQAQEATRMLDDYSIAREPGTTPLFEIIYPENRIVVDYEGRRELVLLDAIDNDTGRSVHWPAFSGPVVPHYGEAPIETLAQRAGPNREGFVVAFDSGHRVKVKFEEYVRLHKIVTGVNARMIWQSLRDDDDLDSLLKDVPDEIYDWITRTRDDLLAEYAAEEARCREVFDATPETAERKEIAAYFTSSDANPGVLFRMLDGRDYSDLIWRTIRPGVSTPEVVAS